MRESLTHDTQAIAEHRDLGSSPLLRASVLISIAASG